MKRLALPVLLTLALAAAACGDSGETTVAGALPEEGPQSFEDIEYESPIADFLGVDTDFNSDESQAEFTEQANRAEEQIAACMREQGFEYTPVDQSQFMSFEAPDEDLPWGSREWTEKYGFGITTQRFSQTEVGPDLIGWDDSEMETFESDFVDPNMDYVDGLSPAEQDAYYEALYGNEPDLGPDATEEDWDAAYQDWEPSGCQAEAWEGENGVFGGPEMAFYEEFGDELDDLYQRLEADPRVAEHLSEVRACVADKGLEYPGDMEDLYELYEEKMAGIGPDYNEDPFEAAGVDPATMTEEEIDAFFEELNQQQLTDTDKALLGELQAEEIELAITVFDCEGSDLHKEVLFSDIRVEYEETFLAENADRLAGFESSAEG